MERLSSLIIALIWLNSGVLLAYDPIAGPLTLPATIYQNEDNEIEAEVSDFDGDLYDVRFEYDGPSPGTNWIQIGQDVLVDGDEDTAQTTWTPTVTGAHKIKYTVTDESGNSDYWMSGRFTVVSGSPEVSSITLPATVFAEKDNTISASVTDLSGNLNEVQFQYDGPAPGTSWVDIGSAVSVSGSSATASISWTPTRTGTYKLKVTVSDDTTSTRDDTRTTGGFEVVEPATPPRVRNITVPSRVYHNQANTLSARVTDINGDLDEALFQYDGPAPGTTWVDIGTVSVYGSSDTASINWTPTLLGTYRIKVTATDEDDNTDTRSSSSFTVECSPVLSN